MLCSIRLSIYNSHTNPNKLTTNKFMPIMKQNVMKANHLNHSISFCNYSSLSILIHIQLFIFLNSINSVL